MLFVDDKAVSPLERAVPATARRLDVKIGENETSILPDDNENPMNWSYAKKLGVMTTVDFIWALALETHHDGLTVLCHGPLCPLMLASGLPELIVEFPTSNPVVQSLLVSIFALGLGIGPLFLGPLSEMFGRSPVYHGSAICYIIFSIGCAFAKTTAALLTLEFFLGCFGAAPITIGGGTVADMFRVEERGRYIALLAVGPLVATAIGPVAAAFLCADVGWRWVFRLMAILGGVAELAFLALMNETYPPVLAARRALLTGPVHSKAFGASFVWRSLVRPFKILFLLPSVLAMCALVSISYAYYYLLTTTLAAILLQQYNWAADIVGLGFLGVAIGQALGAVSFAIISDQILKRAARAQPPRPEQRLHLMVAGAIALPAGLLIYGWCAQYRVHWIVVQLGTAILGLGLMWMLLSLDSYLVDAYPLYAASAIGATTVTRSVLSAFLPLAAPPMYKQLGLGWGNSTLALVALVLLPVPLLVLKYGESWRSAGLMVAKSL